MEAPKADTRQVIQRSKRSQGINCKVSFQISAQQIATIVFGTILLAAMVPSTADAQSWWDQIKKNVEKTTEKVIDNTVGKIIPPDEKQQQQTQQAPQQQQPEPNQQTTGKPAPTYTKVQVRLSQQLLTQLGYKPGPIDGAYGQATARAIRAYQSAHGLPQTGVPSDELIEQMQNNLTVQLAASKPETSSSANSLQSHSQSGSQTTEIASENVQMKKTNFLSLNYPNLLKLYIARHADLLNNEAFAWHYFQIFKAPEKRSLECSELQKKARNPIRFAELVEREKITFDQELRQFAKLPSSGIFSTPVTVQVGNYNPDLQSFPVTRVSVNYNQDLSSQPRCTTYPAPPGPSYAPQGFADGLIKMPSENELPAEIAVSKEVATTWLDSTRLSASALSGRMNLPGVATVRVDPLPFIKDSSVISLKGEVVGLTVEDPLSGEALYSYKFSGDSAGEETATANSGALMELSDASLMLYLIRDNPETMTPRVVREITRQQVQAEQQYWRKIDDNLYSALHGSMGFSNLNSKQPLFAYQWQLLRQHNPSQAQELLKVFISSNESWQFYRNEPNYDSRLGAFVEASIFSREAIGLPDAQTTLQKVKKANSRPSQNVALPPADYLLPELTPVMSDFLRQASQSVPKRFKLDFALNGKFDPYAKRLVLSKDYSGFDDAKPISPLRSNDRANFAANGRQLDSTLHLPLPMSAKNRFIYALPYQSAPIQTRPGLSSKMGSTTDDWRRILAGTRGVRDEKFGAVGGLALDREVAFPPVPVSKETVRRAQGELYRNAAVFPVIARLIVDVERMDMVRLHGRLGSGPEQEIRNCVLLGRATGLEVLDQSGALIHAIDVATLKSAADAASAEQVAQAKAEAIENAAREKQQQELSASREALRNADIIGIRPGMPVAEAENIIRGHMVVGWVGELADDAPGVRSPDRPYNYFRTFISSDGSEHVALYWHPEISNKLQGMTRTLVLPDKMSDEAVLASLKDKYGTDLLVPSQKTPAWVWTVDFGASERLRQVSNPTKEDRFRMGPCQASIQGKFRIRWLDILEGEPISSAVQRRLPSAAGTASISVNGGKSGTYNQPQWEVAQWKECGPTVSANVSSSNLGKVLEVGLFDLSTYGPVYDALMKKKSKEAENQRLAL